MVKYLLYTIIAILILQIVACTSNTSDDKEDIDFSLIPVKTGDKWGFIDKKGKYVINPQFNSAQPFSDGLARVNSNGKIGYINKSGDFVIPAIYERGSHFVDGLAFVVTDESTPICINTKGEVKFQTPTNIWVADAFSQDGIARLQIANNKFGYVDRSGHIVVDTLFGGFSGARSYEGMVAIQSEDDKWGFCNKDGEITVNPQFDNIGHFSNGLAWVRQGKQYGYIDKEGKYVINPQFDIAKDFSSDGLAAVKLGKQWGYINTKGEYIINPQFDMAYSFYNGLAVVMQSQKYGVVNTKGEYVINPQFDYMDDFHKNGLAKIQQNNKVGFVNLEGKIVINPQFDKATDFYGDIAFVQSNDKWGIIDEQGKYIVNPQFDYINYDFVSSGIGSDRVHSTVLYESPIIDHIIDLNDMLNETYENTVGQTAEMGDYKEGSYFESGLLVQSPIKNEMAEMAVNYVFDRNLRQGDAQDAIFSLYVAAFKLYKSTNERNIISDRSYTDNIRVSTYRRKIMTAIEAKENVKFEQHNDTVWIAEGQSIYVAIATSDQEPEVIVVIASKNKNAIRELKKQYE